MKTTLLFALLLVISNLATAQTNNTSESIYLVGSEYFEGYKLEVKTCSTDGQVILSNGRSVPALNCFILDKEEYIGGKLTNSKKTTEIVDIKMEPIGENGAKFIVIGKGFDMSFTLINGLILKMDGDEVTFHTEGEGVWKINKKV